MSKSSFTSDSFTSDTGVDGLSPPPLPLASTSTSTTDADGLVNVNNQPALLQEGNYNDTQQACAANVSSEKKNTAVGTRRSSRMLRKRKEVELGNSRSGSRVDGKNEKKNSSNNPFGLGRPTVQHKLKSASAARMEEGQKKKLASEKEKLQNALDEKKEKLQNALDEKERLTKELARAMDEKLKSEEELGDEYDLMDPAFKPAAEALGIVGPCSTLSCGTTELKNNTNILPPGTPASFALQYEDFNADRAAILINKGSIRGSNPAHCGATFGSKGTRMSKHGKKKVVDAAIGDMRQLVYADWEKRNVGLPKWTEEISYKWHILIPQLAFGSDVDVVLLDENGNRITEEDYKKEDGHKAVKSFELANSDVYDDMRKKCGYSKRKKSAMHQKLLDKKNKNTLVFDCVRYDDEGILGDISEVCAHDERRQTAKYKYTIRDEDKHFAPFDELDIRRSVQCGSCEKWRKLPARISPGELPDEWHCSMNTWDTRFATCEAEEEERDEEPDKETDDVQPKDMNEKSKGFSRVIPRLAFTDGDRLGLVLLDGEGKHVTEEGYKKDDGHKDVRSFELENLDSYDALMIECGYKQGLEGKELTKERKKFQQALTKKRAKKVLSFTLVRYDDEGILGDNVGSTNKRRTTAKYKYTIRADDKYFAPFDELNIDDDRKPAAMETDDDCKPAAVEIDFDIGQSGEQHAMDEGMFVEGSTESNEEYQDPFGRSSRCCKTIRI